MSISQFKATCLAVLERVRRTGQPVVITKRGEAVARVVPPAPVDLPESAFGCMRGTMEFVGDIVAPLGIYDDWPGDAKLLEPE